MSLVRTEFKRNLPTEPKRRVRKCAVKSCRKEFEPRNMTHKCCGAACAIDFAMSERVRKERKERQKGLIALKPVKWWKAKAKTAMHAYVRAIAEGQECASCDTILMKLGRMGGDYDAGHFRPVGMAKHLEFDARNVWGQCKRCNDYLRGNVQEYERRLRIKKGDAFVDELMADNEPRHLKIHDYQEIEAHYKAKLKELTKGVKQPESQVTYISDDEIDPNEFCDDMRDPYEPETD